MSRETAVQLSAIPQALLDDVMFSVTLAVVLLSVAAPVTVLL